MIRRFALCLLALAVALSAYATADDAGRDQPGPLRLKKKDKPGRPEREKTSKPDGQDTKKDQSAHKKPKPEAKDGDAKEGGELDGKDPAEEARQALARAAKNMRASEERLGKKDPGEGTRQIQRDILDDLDSLIKQTQRQQQQQQQQQQSNPSAKSRGPREQRQPQGTGKMRGQQTARRQQPGQGKTTQQAGRQPGQGGPDGGKPGSGKIADVYKDVWGHLPETLRQEMDQYSREQFMAKYNELLKQYYATIAEKGRRKSDQ